MSEPNAPRVRFHSLDALRGVAMILGVVIHASNAYRTDFSYIWAVQDPSRSIIADAIGHVIHAFRMPLFFLLSGFFSRMVYQRVGYREFLRKRWNRVAVPLLLGVFTLTPLSGAVDEFAERRAGPPKIDIFNPVVWKNRDTVKSAAGSVAEPPAYFDVLSRAPWPLSLLRHTALGYLWFLYDLMVFFVIVPVLATRLADRLGSNRLATIDRFVRRWATSAGAALPAGLALLPFLYWQSLTLYSWSTGTQISIFLPFPVFLLGFLEMNMLGYYLVFFALGWLLHRQPDVVLDQAERHRWHLTTGTVALLASFTLQTMYLLDFSHPLYWGIRLVASLAYSVGTVSLCLGAIGFFERYLRSESRRWRYLADASYWIYLSHLPLVVLAQLAIAPMSAPWWFKLVIVTLTAMTLSLWSYERAVRRTWLGRLLNG